MNPYTWDHLLSLSLSLSLSPSLLPCLNTPASTNCLPSWIPSSLVLTSPLVINQSINSRPMKLCLYVWRWYFLSWMRLLPSVLNLREREGGREEGGREGREGERERENWMYMYCTKACGKQKNWMWILLCVIGTYTNTSCDIYPTEWSCTPSPSLSPSLSSLSVSSPAVDSLSLCNYHGIRWFLVCVIVSPEPIE